jgi:hypothetical protein
MTPLPGCRWRGEPRCDHRFGCDSPFLRVAPAGVPADYCASCHYADRDLPPALAARREGKAACVTPPAEGPGAELARLIGDLGLSGEQGCECAARAAQMNAWGVEGCRERAEEITTWLREQGAKLGWLGKLKAGALAASQGLLLNPLDPAPGLLEEAIRRAERKAVSP